MIRCSDKGKYNIWTRHALYFGILFSLAFQPGRAGGQ